MNLKKTLFSFVAVISFALVSFTFSGGYNPDAQFQVDPSKSTLIWKGKKVGGEHTGTIKLNKGSLIVDGKKITGGEFEIDMASITVTDITDATYNKKLVDHLKSDDFFGTEKFKTSSFKLKEITSKGNDDYEVKGDLTVKGKTNPITFPAKITESGNQLLVKANVVVDRAKYDIKYGSGSFFDNLGDKLIYDDFELELNLVAEKLLAKK